MKKHFLILVLTLIIINAFSQRKVTGTIQCEGTGLIGTKIQELGTDNSTIAIQEGKFTLVTLKDTCKLNFSFVGLETKTIEITKDTMINITLEAYHYDYHWLTIGANYDVINSTYGFAISNGLDENPLIHFEEFSDDWIFKISGNTNLKKDYSFETKITYKYLFILRVQPSIEFIHTDYSTKKYKLSDLNLTCGFWLRRIQSNFNVKIGYQTLNEYNNFDAELGLQKRINKMYGGFMVGYRFKYFTYKIYLQSFIYKYKISLRANYEYIDKYDFLTIGLNYTFER